MNGQTLLNIEYRRKIRNHEETIANLYAQNAELILVLKQLVENTESCEECEGHGTLKGNACRHCGGTGEQLQSYGLVIADIIPDARAILAKHIGG